MIIIIQIITVLVLLHLDQTHLLLLAIITTVSLVIQELVIIVHTSQLIHCGIGMGVITLIIIVVPTLICLGSFDNFHQSSPIHDYLEARICKRDGFVYRDALIESIELYVQ